MTERYIDIHEVVGKVSMSARSIRRKVKARAFPAPFKWGKGWAWLESEVDRWMLVNAVRLQIDPDSLPDEADE